MAGSGRVRRQGAALRESSAGGSRGRCTAGGARPADEGAGRLDEHPAHRLRRGAVECRPSRSSRPAQPTQMERAIKAGHRPVRVIVFTSTNAVRAVREKFESRAGRPRVCRVKIACVARPPETRCALRHQAELLPRVSSRPRPAPPTPALRRGARPDRPGAAARADIATETPGRRAARARLGDRRRDGVPHGARRAAGRRDPSPRSRAMHATTVRHAACRRVRRMRTVEDAGKHTACEAARLDRVADLGGRGAARTVRYAVTSSISQPSSRSPAASVSVAMSARAAAPGRSGRAPRRGREVGEQASDDCSPDGSSSA